MRRSPFLSIIAVAVVLSGLAGCGGQDESSAEADTPARVQLVVDGVERPLERLEDAVEQARPRSRSSMVQLRAAAERAADELDDAAADLHDLNAQVDADDGAAARDAEDAVDSLARLASALAALAPSVDRIEAAAAAAKIAVDDLDAVRLRALDAEAFVRALRRERRRRPARQAAPPASTVVGGTQPDAAEGALGADLFQTGRDPGEATAAAYCHSVPGELRCWTPNDGFTVVLDLSGARRDRASESGNRRYEPGGAQLSPGLRWTSDGFTCDASTRALTCTNPSGHGFTLPRYRGLPSYF